MPKPPAASLGRGCHAAPFLNTHPSGWGFFFCRYPSPTLWIFTGAFRDYPIIRQKKMETCITNKDTFPGSLLLRGSRFFPDCCKRRKWLKIYPIALPVSFFNIEYCSMIWMQPGGICARKETCMRCVSRAMLGRASRCPGGTPFIITGRFGASNGLPTLPLPRVSAG